MISAKSSEPRDFTPAMQSNMLPTGNVVKEILPASSHSAGQTCESEAVPPTPFAKRLHQALTLRNMKKMHAEQQAKLAKGVLSKILRGSQNSLHPAGFTALCEVLQIEPRWLSTGEGEMIRSSTATIQSIVESPLLSGTPEFEAVVRTNPGRWSDEAIAAARVYSRQGREPERDWAHELDRLTDFLGLFASHLRKRSYENTAGSK